MRQTALSGALLLAAVGEDSPAAAVSDVTGSVWRSGGSGEPPKEAAEGARAGEVPVREVQGGAEFVQAGAGLRTGEDGVVHGLA